jgi:hypothetical protein
MFMASSLRLLALFGREEHPDVSEIGDRGDIGVTRPGPTSCRCTRLAPDDDDEPVDGQRPSR